MTFPAAGIRSSVLLNARFLKIFSGIITLIFILLWYNLDSEAEPWSIWPGKQESTRINTLRKIADATNKGYYFQYEPGVPMEHIWEDPGIGFLMVCMGILKRFLGLGPLDALVDPYRAELLVIGLPLILIFFTRLFSLPRWYWLIPPLFFLWAIVPKYPLFEQNIGKLSGLLYLSVSTRWVRVPAAFWTFTATLQFFGWWHEGKLFELNLKRIFRLLVIGFVMGIFWSIRKDVLVASGLATTIFLFLLTFSNSSLNKIPNPLRVPRAKKIVPLLILLLILFAGCRSFRTLIEGAWWLRDRNYQMQNTSRIYGRPVWHSLCAGLGVVQNRYGINWGDEEVFRLIKRRPENKEVVYGTVEHERAARKLYFELLTKDPDLVFRNLRFKLKYVWLDHRNGIMRSLALIMILFFLNAYARWIGVLLLCNMATAGLILVIVNPWLQYGLDLITHYRLAQMIGFGVGGWRLGEILLPKIFK